VMMILNSRFIIDISLKDNLCRNIIIICQVGSTNLKPFKQRVAWSLLFRP